MIWANWSENWTVPAFLQLTPRLSNNFTAVWLTFTFPQLFAVAATLKSIDYTVAMTFILNNNNNNNCMVTTCVNIQVDPQFADIPLLQLATPTTTTIAKCNDDD